MQPTTTVSSVWKNRSATEPYQSGVSLHSHTSHSEETLTFIHKMFVCLPVLSSVFAHYERQSRRHDFQLDFVRGNWRPPLVPRMAYDVEANQIMNSGLQALVSITDHDNIEAPMLLRTVPSSRGIPVSVEWTVPFGGTEFHVGIHNLPAAEGHFWLKRFADYTQSPNEERFFSMLNELHEMSGVLIVLNHPVWDLHNLGREHHEREMLRFLQRAGCCIHALELNGLRHVRENRRVAQLARDMNYLLISGGDRHSLEPNACINLSQATNFREFVEEIRVERRSHILFMEQYSKSWEARILHSTLDAVTDFPQFTEGWRRWDDRCFHPDREGTMRPLSELWMNDRAPLPLRAAIEFVRLGRSRTFTKTFSMAFAGSGDPLAEMELL